MATPTMHPDKQTDLFWPLKDAIRLEVSYFDPVCVLIQYVDLEEDFKVFSLSQSRFHCPRGVQTFSGEEVMSHRVPLQFCPDCCHELKVTQLKVKAE